MKKTFRILLALTLSALLLLPATAFALANGDAVEWTFSEEEITSYIYAGEAADGAAVTIAQPFRAVKFTPSVTGIYTVTVEPTGGESDEAYVNWWGVSETFDGVAAAGDRPRLAFSENADFEDAQWNSYYLTAGQTVLIGVDEFESPDGKVALTVQSAGYDVAAIEVAGLRPLYVINDLIWTLEDPAGEADQISIDAKFLATVRTVDGDSARLYCTPVITGTLQSGACNLTARLGSAGTDFTVQCVAIDDLISHAEFPADYTATATKNEEGTIWIDEMPAQLLVTMTDGTTQTVELEHMEESNTSTGALTVGDDIILLVSVNMTADYSEEEPVFEVVAECCEEILARVPCTVSDAGEGDDEPELSFFQKVVAFFTGLIARIRAFFASIIAFAA